MKRFEDYKAEVIEAYHTRQKEGTLPPNLQRPTAARLRAECLDVFTSRYLDSDHETFKAIFGERNGAEEYYKKIQTSSADKFKPLDNFLKKNTEDTKEKNIELLAWLLNIEPRPFRPVDMYFVGRMTAGTPKQVVEGVPTEEQPTEEHPTVEHINTNEKAVEPSLEPRVTTPANLGSDHTKNLKKISTSNSLITKTLAVALPLCILLGIFLSLNAGKDQCMYWNGDQYVPVACDQKMSNLNVIALVPEKVQKLKRITTPDTLTEYSIGKVWRGRIDGKIEFFTDSGAHPVDNRKRLLPLTKYMLEKYIQHKLPADSSTNTKKGQQ